MPLSAKNRPAIMKYITEHAIRHHIGFQNFTHNVVLPNAIVLDIENEEQLQQLIVHINNINKDESFEEKITLRVAAGGQKEFGHAKKYSESFSLTPCAEGDVIVRLIGAEFQKIEVLDKEKNIVRVGASVQIGDLDNTLYHEHKLCMPTSSLIPFVTLAGLAATAGHGTGRDQPSVAGLIRAMTLCLPDGTIQRIDASHPDFETIRASHLGLFGAVFSLEIECVKAAKLQCVMEARSINELVEEIKNGLFYKYTYISIMYVPTYQKHERDKKNVIVFRWEPVALDVENTNITPKLTHIEQNFSIKMNNLFNVPGFLTQHSCLIPPYMKYLVARMEVGSTDTIAVGPWPDIAHYQTAFPWSLDDADYLFNTRGKSCTEIVKAIEFVSLKLKEYARRGQYPIIDAVYLRFFKGTNGGLSTSATQYMDEHICGFDIVSNAGIPGYSAFKAEMEQFFSGELHARPHWGKTVPLNIDYAKLYGEHYTAFMRVLILWHKKCGLTLENSPFMNSFFRTVLQMSTKPLLTLDINTEAQHEQKTDPTIFSPRQVYEAAQQVLAHIAELNLNNTHIRELKENLEQFVEEHPPQPLYFDTDKKQRNSFLQSIGTTTSHISLPPIPEGSEKPKEASEKDEEEKASTRCRCIVS
jgi:hypothetical protein